MSKIKNMEKERKLFTETDHCKLMVHCHQCRRKELGRKFRISLTSLFKLPNDEIDFVCPYGKDWINEDNLKQKTASAQPLQPETKKGCGCSRAKKQKK